MKIGYHFRCIKVSFEKNELPKCNMTQDKSKKFPHCCEKISCPPGVLSKDDNIKVPVNSSPSLKTRSSDSDMEKDLNDEGLEEQTILESAAQLTNRMSGDMDNHGPLTDEKR